MFIRVNKSKINIKELSSFVDKIKSIRFVLDTIDYGLLYKNKSIINTYLYCQRVDICFTDENYKIIKIYSNVKSEKILFSFKSKHIFILPLNTCKYLKIGEELKIH